MNIVYGGAFNPPTKAHLNIIKKVYRIFSPEKVVVIPVGDDYHKPFLVPFYHRYEMCLQLTKALSYINVLDIENRYPFKGTFETLMKLESEYHDIYLLIGADQFMTIRSWIRYEELLVRYGLIVVNRDRLLTQEMIKTMGLKAKDIRLVDSDEVEKSSLFRSDPKRYASFLTQPVLDYIQKNTLYRGGSHV